MSWKPRDWKPFITDNAGECAEVKELLYLTAEVQDAALPDATIEKHKVQAEYD